MTALSCTLILKFMASGSGDIENPNNSTLDERTTGFYKGFRIWEFPKIRGTLIWGPYNEDPTIWGTIFGSPIFGNSHMALVLILRWCTHTHTWRIMGLSK